MSSECSDRFAFVSSWISISIETIITKLCGIWSSKINKNILSVIITTCSYVQKTISYKR